MRTRRAGRATASVALVTAGLLLAGCEAGGSGDSAGGEPSGLSDVRVQEDVGAADDAAPGSEGGSEGGSGDSSDADLGRQSASGGGTRVAPAVARRAVIATATVSLDAPDVAKVRQEVQRVADALGGEVSDEEATTDEGEVTWARMVLRIPVDRYDDAIGRIEESGRLLGTERTTEDVTTQVIDNEVRIRAQERSLRRVELLLDRAERLADVVSVEAELTRRQAELDSLKQQQAWLADQTSMATVTVHVSRQDPEREPLVEDDDEGFLHGLAAGWRGLTGAAAVLATGAGLLLPWLVALGLLGVPAWWAVRRLPRRRRATPGGGPA
ncbi:DUF4349 domain-containing protein [Nocardioides solisilvae]|uniref:DUF4349 domain-containing protein n=1 Tax=Nocardioides solisilvae TaxID=1542435 RepID=UPI000D740B84|nr:DUF4349 domain-containing protein [Nocardioides solisilvae]